MRNQRTKGRCNGHRETRQTGQGPGGMWRKSKDQSSQRIRMGSPLRSEQLSRCEKHSKPPLGTKGGNELRGAIAGNLGKFTESLFGDGVIGKADEYSATLVGRELGNGIGSVKLVWRWCRGFVFLSCLCKVDELWAGWRYHCTPSGNSLSKARRDVRSFVQAAAHA